VRNTMTLKKKSKREKGGWREIEGSRRRI